MVTDHGNSCHWSTSLVSQLNLHLFHLSPPLHGTTTGSTCTGAFHLPTLFPLIPTTDPDHWSPPRIPTTDLRHWSPPLTSHHWSHTTDPTPLIPTTDPPPLIPTTDLHHWSHHGDEDATIDASGNCPAIVSVCTSLQRCCVGCVWACICTFPYHVGVYTNTCTQNVWIRNMAISLIYNDESCTSFAILVSMEVLCTTV